MRPPSWSARRAPGCCCRTRRRQSGRRRGARDGGIAGPAPPIGVLIGINGVASPTRLQQAWERTRRQDREGTMAKVLGGVRRPKAVCGILVGLLGLLVTVGPPAGAAELAPNMPPTPPIELRSPVAPEAGIRSVDYDSWIGPHVINVMP